MALIYDKQMKVLVDTEQTAKISEDKIAEIVRKVFPLTPQGMIRHLNLLRPIYSDTAHGGHFGRKGDGFTWEKTDMVGKLRKAAGLKPKK
jgi:S-adenosylmethionine synthetase